jgi:uncharacterized protein
MMILVTGGTGFLGRAAVGALLAAGHEVIVLTRSPDRVSVVGVTTVQWDGVSALPSAVFDGVEGILNLMGEGIADKRWSTAQRKRLRDSRILGTRALVRGAIAHAKHLSAFICASAVGYYDSAETGDVTEMRAPGSDFLAQLCVDWETEAQGISKIMGVRELRLRLGMVVGPGGAIHKLRPLFLWGLGGKLGDGRQWMNWIHRDDVVQILLTALDDDTYFGAYNAVSPDNVSNAQFTRALGRTLKRPTLFWVPGLFLRLFLGQMATVLLNGPHVVPDRLLKNGFSFRYSRIENALEHVT